MKTYKDAEIIVLGTRLYVVQDYCQVFQREYREIVFEDSPFEPQKQIAL